MIKELKHEIAQLTDRLGRMVETFGRTFNMSLAVEITETRRLLREKKDELAQVETVASYKQ